ncbi:arginine deiminase [Vibrio splendidus]|uniref:arginine deiminase n=1 Tax=Vibrio splendidus TaxID=29497 RepID=UPI001F53A874|nr:arginine deiminase [Vibrio splendidus]
MVFACLSFATEIGHREALNEACAAREVVLVSGLELDSIAIKKAAKKAALDENGVKCFKLDKRTNT